MPNTTSNPDRDARTSDAQPPNTQQDQEPLDPQEFARQNSAAALKNQDAPGPKTLPGPAEARDNVASVRADDLDQRIARSQQELEALQRERQQTVVQEYPKMLYHTDHADKNNPMQPVIVTSKEKEDEARGLGWVHANPGEAMKASKTQKGKTPDATQHTREDENARRDLPAQMAADQDARTGKPPIDLVLDSDAPDPGAPKAGQAGTGGVVQDADAARDSRNAVADDLKNAQRETSSRDTTKTTKRDGGR